MIRDWNKPATILESEGWTFHGIYGQYKTASSVAYALRQQGWKTQTVNHKEGNVSVYKKRKTT